MNLNRIKTLAEKKGITIVELCKRSDISHSGFYKNIQKGEIKVSRLEKLANVLGVSPGYFFEDSANPEDHQVKDKPGDYEKTEPVNLKCEAELLKELIREKDKRLKLLEEKHIKSMP